MSSSIVPRLRALVCAFACVFLAFSISAAAQDSAKKDQAPQISDGERNAIEKIKTASGADAKLKASSEYVKKFAKSPMRPNVAGHVADEIIAVKDNNQKISLAQNFMSVFNQPDEADLIKPTLIEGYLGANKFDEAVTESQKHLEKNPDDVITLTQLAWAGAMQAQKQAANPKLLQTASAAGAKAVELMEADKKPERMDAANWAGYRNSWLPRLYQAQGVIMYYSNDKVGAKDKLEKAAGIEPYEPSTLLLLSDIANAEYQDLAKRYQTEKKSDLLTQALSRLDETIDYLARAAAATEGNAQYQATNQQLMENLKAYYSFRYEGKMDGLNELLKKYKKP